MAEITRICSSPLLSRHDIPLDRQKRRREKNGLDNLGTESEKERVGRERERSVAFKRTVYPSVKNVWIVSYPFVSRAIRFGCHSVMRTEGRRGNIQSQSLS